MGSPLLRDTVYEQLRDAIVAGRFAPGERIRDLDLVEWLGASRTPIREAFLRLEQAGLLESRPGQATVVTPVDSAATRHAQQVAGAMHGLAAELAASRLTEAELVAMETANTELAHALSAGDIDAAVAADDDFHRVVVVASGNPRIADMLEQVAPLVRRVERLRFASFTSRDSIAQHARIIEWFRQHDPAAAAAATRANWRTLDAVLDGIGKAERQSRNNPA